LSLEDDDRGRGENRASARASAWRFLPPGVFDCLPFSREARRDLRAFGSRGEEGMSPYGARWLLAVAGFGTLVASVPATALDLNFDYKLNQGATGVTFATLSLNEFTPGVTTFSLATALSGGSGNPDIVELLFGCTGCNNPTFTPGGLDVAIGPGGTQSGYTFEFRAEFDPAVNGTNDTRTWTANRPVSAFLDPTGGSGPDAFAVIQLTGGTETIGGQNISSGFYIAAVPEPETYAILLAGLGLVGCLVRRRRKQA
jgi:hypothetical protein